jgi:hypothetical protein
MIKKRFFYRMAFLLATLFLLSGCASIVSKVTYPISISSNPVGAKVSITDKKGIEIYQGNTPASLYLRAGSGYFSKAEYLVTLSSPGYDDKTMPVHFKLDGWYIGNIVFGGLIGMLIVDPATGAMWKIENEHISENLQPSQTNLTTPELKIVDINDVPVKLKSYLQRLN